MTEPYARLAATPLGRAMRAVDETERKEEGGGSPATDAEVNELVALQIRDEARADALTIITRARVRGGRRPDIWTSLDAATAYNVADLILLVQGQMPSPLDEAFNKVKVDRDKLARAAAVERSLRTGAAPAPGQEAAQSE